MDNLTIDNLDVSKAINKLRYKKIAEYFESTHWKLVTIEENDGIPNAEQLKAIVIKQVEQCFEEVKSKNLEHYEDYMSGFQITYYKRYNYFHLKIEFIGDCSTVCLGKAEQL